MEILFSISFLVLAASSICKKNRAEARNANLGCFCSLHFFVVSDIERIIHNFPKTMYQLEFPFAFLFLSLPYHPQPPVRKTIKKVCETQISPHLSLHSFLYRFSLRTNTNDIAKKYEESFPFPFSSHCQMRKKMTS